MAAYSGSFQKISLSLSVRICMAFFVLIYGSLARCDSVAEPSAISKDPIKILVLYSYHKDMPWNLGFEKGIKEGMKKWPGKVQMYHEFLDASRFPISENPAFLQSIRNRYGGEGIDYVVALSEAASFFVDRHPDFIPGAKYISIDYASEYSESRITVDGQDIAISIGNDFEASLREMFELTQSRPKRLVVVVDTEEAGGLHRLHGLQRAIENTGVSIPVEYLADMSMEEYKNRLSRLPKNSVIYYLLLFGDPETGEKYTPYEAVTQLSAVANAPIFSYWDTLLGSGIIGGYLVSSEDFGHVSAKTILTLEQGGKPLLEAQDGFTFLYDWRQLRRWKVDADFLDELSEIRYVEPSPWKIHQKEIIGTIVILLMLVVFVILLQIEVKRKTHYLVIARDEAKQASVAKSEFLANISHELRTPMNAIMGMSELALNFAENPKQRNFIQKAIKASKVMLDVINKLLDFSNIDRGGMDFQPIPFPIEDILNGFAAVTKQKSENKSINLSMRLEPGITNFLVGDPVYLAKVLDHLADNAVKFTEPGGHIDIDVSIREEEQTSLLMHFCIKDTGIGIRPEDQKKLFQPFTQVDGSSTRKYGGMGLGLALVRRLVKMMGGKIWVESEPEKGSAFHFTARFGKRDM